jgi:DNA-binding transcriptional MerR regulator
VRYKTSVGKMYYSISEVSEMTSVKPHVLRYWESEFPTLRPKKNRAGNRNYRPKDIKAILVIRDLLYREKFTISGARKKLQETYGNPDPLIDQMQIPFSDPHARQILLKIKRDLHELKDMLLGPEEEDAQAAGTAEVEAPSESKSVANSS